MMTIYQHISVPAGGEEITLDEHCTLGVPDNPVIPYIDGDGIGMDVTPVMLMAVDTAVLRAYGGRREIRWMRVLAGEMARAKYGPGQWVPEETLHALRRFRVSIKGPLATPFGSSRSLDVLIHEALDLYACVRPIRYFEGVSAPLRNPAAVNMVVFRENMVGMSSGVDYAAGSAEARRLIMFLQGALGTRDTFVPWSSGVGIKPISREGTQRLVRKALQYAVANSCDKVTLVHNGNIMNRTEGAFIHWGYEVAQREFGAIGASDGQSVAFSDSASGHQVIMNDVTAENFLQQSLLRPEQFEVIVILNLHGDFISDALAAQVGVTLVSPRANLGDGVAVFEATHGAALDIAGKYKANPSSLILSAEMMLRHLGWNEAADVLLCGVTKAIRNSAVTADLASDGEGLTTQEFGRAVIWYMGA